MTPGQPSCPQCGAALEQGARFCTNCGTPVSRTEVCATCGADLHEGARFCRACGTPVPEEATAGAAERACAACGSALSAGAAFCKRCGRPVGPGAAPAHRTGRAQARRGTRKSPLLSPRVAGPVAAVLLAVVAGVGAFLFFGGEGKKETTEDTGTPTESKVVKLETAPDVDDEGRPVRAASRLEHPAGAQAELPRATVYYSDRVDLRRMEMPALEGERWDRGGIAWVFESSAGITPVDPITIDLPARTGAKVIIRTSFGEWVELPSEAVKMPSGDGLRVRLANVPTPWTLAVATPAPGAAALSEEEADSLRLQQLYLTDRDAWTAEMSEWLASTDPERFPEDQLQASLHPRAQTLDEALRKVEKHVLFTQRVFDGVTLPEGQEFRLTGVPLYLAGLRRLEAVRNEWVELRGTSLAAPSGAGRDDFQVRWLERRIETLLANYAPWGLDLTLELGRLGLLDKIELGVLVPYGEKYYTDVAIPAMAPGSAIETAIRTMSEQFEGDVDVSRSLRLYSTRAVHDTAWLDPLKSRWGEGLVRWLPVALALLFPQYVAWEVGLSFAWASLDQLIDWVQDYYEKPGDKYTFMLFEGAGTAVGGASFVLDVSEELARVKQTGAPFYRSHGLTVAQFAYTVGMFIAVRETDWFALKDVRAASEGTNAYCVQGSCPWFSNVIPPINLVARLGGAPKNAEAAYPATRTQFMAWKLRFPVTDLHATWSREVPVTKKAASAGDLDWVEFQKEVWPSPVSSSQPHMQSLRFAIPKSFLAEMAKKYGLSGDAPISAYKFTLTIETPDGAKTEFSVPEAAAPRPDDDPDNAYVAAILRRSGVDKLQKEEIIAMDRTYFGKEAEVEGGVLRTSYNATLGMMGDNQDALEYVVDAGKGKGRVLPLVPLKIGYGTQSEYRDRPETLVLHYVDVAPKSRTTGGEGHWALVDTRTQAEAKAGGADLTYTVSGGAGELLASCRFAGNNFSKPGSADETATWSAIPGEAKEDETFPLTMAVSAISAGEGPCVDLVQITAGAVYTSSNFSFIVAYTDPRYGPSVVTSKEGASKTMDLTFTFPRFEAVWGPVHPELNEQQLAAARTKEHPRFTIAVQVNSSFAESLAVYYDYEWQRVK